MIKQIFTLANGLFDMRFFQFADLKNSSTLSTDISILHKKFKIVKDTFNLKFKYDSKLNQHICLETILLHWFVLRPLSRSVTQISV